LRPYRTDVYSTVQYRQTRSSDRSVRVRLTLTVTLSFQHYYTTVTLFPVAMNPTTSKVADGKAAAPASGDTHVAQTPGDVTGGICQNDNCDMDRSVGGAYACVTCHDMKLCEAHALLHRRQQHDTIDSSDGNPISVCERHAQLISLYCTACATGICHRCCNSNHVGHKIVPMAGRSSENAGPVKSSECAFFHAI
jgi:hypothetical protein